MRKGVNTKKVIFSISKPEARECSLLLFTKGDGKPSLEFSMLKKKNGTFYVETEIESTDVENIEYLFNADGELICDPKAKRISGRSTFNSPKEKKEPKAMLADFQAFSEDLYSVNSLDDLILYELHVRNFTLHESSGVKAPGTFSGVVEKIPYLKKLGITGVMLMPVFDFDETFLPGRVNVWGYNCRNTFYYAPKASYAASDNSSKEFKTMVEKLHASGIDVYMDMIFDRDITPAVMLDCACMYASVYSVDGFRIDDSRMNPEVFLSDDEIKNCRFFTANPSSDLMRKYPSRLIPCNEAFKDNMRRFIKGDEGLSVVLYNYMKERSEKAPVCFIADHNGFCLNDLYTYDVRHNQKNGENGKDGTEFNYSWNCGEEGETSNRKIKALRTKMIKNALATVFLAGGIPMLSAGDEFGMTKLGNNNTYCQDNELSYIDWKLMKVNREQLSFTKELIAFRKDQEVLKKTRELRETDYKGFGIPEISVHGTSPWLMDYQPYNRLVGIYFGGEYVDGEKASGDVYIIYNMHWEAHIFTIPERNGKKMCVAFDTSKKHKRDEEVSKQITAEPRSVIVLTEKR